MALQGITSHYAENETTYHVASEEECELLISSAMDLLEKTGIEVTDQETIDLLTTAGCTLGGKMVKIPRELVVKAIDSAPSHIEIFDRKGGKAMDLGGTNVYFGTGPTNPFVNDFETGARRGAKVEDVSRSTLVTDACDEIDFVMNLAEPGDCPPDISDVYSMAEMLKNTTKPIMCLAKSATSLSEQFEMVTAVSGGWDEFRRKPFVLCLCGDPVTPLAMPEDAAQKLIYCSENMIPFNCPSGCQLGSTSPVTIAGGIVLGLAENLFCLVLSQIVNPGCPYIGGVVILTVDMRTMVPCYGSPEHCLGESLIADIYHYLDLPLMGTAGSTEAKIVDEQFAIETSYTVHQSIIDGGHLVHDIGFMDCALTTQLEALPLSDEIIGYARRIERGVTIDEESIALDVIAEVGPGGEFLTTDHTADNYMDEEWVPGLLERRIYAQWSQDGKDMRTRVHDKVARILSEHIPEPLSEDVLKTLDETLSKALKRVSR